jgi:hypothetical protein
MSDPVTLMLADTDDDLCRAIDQVGGADRARKLLFDYAKAVEHCGSLDDFVLLIVAFDRIEELASSAAPPPKSGNRSCSLRRRQ